MARCPNIQYQLPVPWTMYAAKIGPKNGPSVVYRTCQSCI